MKNLMLQDSVLQAAAENLNGDEFKDFILKLNDYFLNGVMPEFTGFSKILFGMYSPYLDYMSEKYDKRVNEALGLDTISTFPKQQNSMEKTKEKAEGNFVGVITPNDNY